jgi:hypothetical protein
MEEGMKAWMMWAEKCGDRLVDFGTPLANGLKLDPGEGWFTLLRLYAPLEPIFDKTWRWNDIEKIENTK